MKYGDEKIIAAMVAAKHESNHNITNEVTIDKVKYRFEEVVTFQRSLGQ